MTGSRARDVWDEPRPARLRRSGEPVTREETTGGVAYAVGAS
ncbi:hypothetical protein [Sphaerisporangium sp. TRM90804]|nr:hypothetical protein [Sphaerisporangium sp. TRM90804]MDH2424198.1 hypothetical protein [Sphaerisporangium sp. TRM90804]